MTDPRPICPIPPDAKKGDIVVLRDGQRRIISSSLEEGEYFLEGRDSPGGIDSSGNNWLHCESCASWDCIAFEYADGRKPNLPHTGKPKRTQAQRDAAWLRTMANRWYSALLLTKSTLTRMNNIADRLEKQQ